MVSPPAPQPCAGAPRKVGAESRSQVAEVHIWKMKTRWGTWNRAACRMWLNLELAKNRVSCLECLMVHEMVQLVVCHHNDRSRDLMDKLLSQWRFHWEEFNRAAFAREDWRCSMGPEPLGRGKTGTANALSRRYSFLGYHLGRSKMKLSRGLPRE